MAPRRARSQLRRPRRPWQARSWLRRQRTERRVTRLMRLRTHRPRLPRRSPRTRPRRSWSRRRVRLPLRRSRHRSTTTACSPPPSIDEHILHVASRCNFRMCYVQKDRSIIFLRTPALTYLSHLLDADTVTSFAKHLCSSENQGKWTIHPSIQEFPRKFHVSQQKYSRRTFVDVFTGKSQRKS